MSAKYQIDKLNRVKFVKISEKTDFYELESIFYQYIRDVDFEPDLRILADIRYLNNPVAGLWEIQKLKKLYQYAYCDAKGIVDVVIVAKEGAAYRAARAFSFFMYDKKPLNVTIVSNLEDALKLLNLNGWNIPKFMQPSEAKVLTFVKP